MEAELFSDKREVVLPEALSLDPHVLVDDLSACVGDAVGTQIENRKRPCHVLKIVTQEGCIHFYDLKDVKKIDADPHNLSNPDPQKVVSLDSKSGVRLTNGEKKPLHYWISFDNGSIVQVSDYDILQMKNEEGTVCGIKSEVDPFKPTLVNFKKELVFPLAQPPKKKESSKF